MVPETQREELKQFAEGRSFYVIELDEPTSVTANNGDYSHTEVVEWAVLEEKGAETSGPVDWGSKLGQRIRVYG